jgi:hypothetical protein
MAQDVSNLQLQSSAAGYGHQNASVLKSRVLSEIEPFPYFLLVSSTCDGGDLQYCRYMAMLYPFLLQLNEASHACQVLRGSVHCRLTLTQGSPACLDAAIAFPEGESCQLEGGELVLVGPMCA